MQWITPELMVAHKLAVQITKGIIPVDGTNNSSSSSSSNKINKSDDAAAVAVIAADDVLEERRRLVAASIIRDSVKAVSLALVCNAIYV
jgi:hypothetical protein